MTKWSWLQASNALRTMVLMALLLSVQCPAIRGEPATLALKMVGNVPTPIMMHGAAVVKNRIYVLGGNDGKGWSKAVWSGKINTDSSITDWRAETDLPDHRAYIMNTVQVVGNRIYIIGGMNYPSAASGENTGAIVADILWAEVGADGKIGMWKRSESYAPAKVSNAASFASDKGLYMIGGHGGTAGIRNTAIMAELAPDGSIKQWKQLNSLPQSVWFHGTGLLENRVFVWGGLAEQQTDKMSDKIFVADMQPDGSLGKWSQQGTISTSIYSSGFVGMYGFLVSVAGRYSNAYPTNGIWYAPVANGKAGEWVFLSTDLQARLYIALAVDRPTGRIFVVGGRDRKGRNAQDDPNAPIRDTIQAFQLTPPKS